MYYYLYNWIGEHEITKLKKKNCFESRQRTQKQAQKKGLNGMTQNGLFDIFSNELLCKILMLMYFNVVFFFACFLLFFIITFIAIIIIIISFLLFIISLGK